jgi:hypothetical protein
MERRRQIILAERTLENAQQAFDDEGDVIKEQAGTEDAAHMAQWVGGGEQPKSPTREGVDEERRVFDSVHQAATLFAKAVTADPLSLRARIGCQRAELLLLQAEKRRAAFEKMQLLKARHGDNWREMMVLEAEASEAEMKKVFELIDKDGSGTLDRGEIGVMADYFNLAGTGPGGKMTDSELDAAMAQMDDDNSGEVEFVEFQEWYIDYRHKMEASKDGSAQPAQHSPKPQSWADAQRLGKEKGQREREALVVAYKEQAALAVLGGDAAAKEPEQSQEEAARWALGKVLRWPDGTSRAIFSKAEHELHLVHEQAASRGELSRLVMNVPLFRELPKRARAELVGRMTIQHYDEGEQIVQQGQAGSVCYILKAGTCEVMVDGNKVEEFGAPSFFGEVSLISAAGAEATLLPSTIQARAGSGHVEVWTVDRATFKHLPGARISTQAVGRKWMSKLKKQASQDAAQGQEAKELPKGVQADARGNICR